MEKNNLEKETSMQRQGTVNVSIVIVAKNEEQNLPDCLKSCDFAKEIILVDDESTDKTVEIAESFGAKVFKRALAGNWGEQQTFAIKQASCPWIFFIDCDERITEELKDSITQIVKKNAPFCYAVQIVSKFKNFKIEHGSLRTAWYPRLFPNDGVFVTGRVHQEFHSNHPLKKANGKLLHYSFSSMSQYYSKMNKYAELSALKYYENKKKFNFFIDVVLRPIWATFKVYFLNKGFLDGKMGIVFAINHYGYTAQKYIRYWVIQKTGKDQL